MIGGISANGGLWIVKDGKKSIHQYCPYQSREVSGRCGTHCPLFSELYRDAYGRVVIDICQGVSLTFDDFEDARKK